MQCGHYYIESNLENDLTVLCWSLPYRIYLLESKDFLKERRVKSAFFNI